MFVLADYEELSKEAARTVARELILKPESVLALPTGDTPIGMYRELVRLYREGLLDFSQATTFNLDEYLGIPPDHPQNFKSYMHRHLWDQVNLRGENVHIPSSLPKDPDQECAGYEALIREAGGLDLAVLGIGENGHIGFNEPGTPWESVTHIAELALETRKREAAAFGGLENVPERAITMGLKTVIHARAILLLASGAEKAEVLAQALHGPVSVHVPASILQLHPNLTVVADKAAARFL
jgi:glucosamine-6-phosphate deaminase